MKNIIVTSFGANPYVDGKPAAAWNFILQGTRSNRITLVTSARNKEGIRNYFDNNRKQRSLLHRVEVRYFDIPASFNFLYRSRSLRPLFYYVWQMGVALHLLGRSSNADLCHDLNMYSGLIPSFLWILGKPLVWGPVTASADRSRYCSTRSEVLCCRMLRLLSRIRWTLDPFLLICKARAEKILYANEEARIALNSVKRKLEFMPISGAEIPVIIPENSECFQLVSFGDPFTTGSHEKVVHAFHALHARLGADKKTKACLHLVARPDETEQLTALVNSLGLGEKIFVRSNLTRYERSQLLQRARAVVVAGLHDYEHHIAEAQSFGLPVVCTHPGADPYLNPHSSLRMSEKRGGAAIIELSEKLQNLADSGQLLATEKQLASEHFFRFYRWTSKREQMEKVYEALDDGERPAMIRGKAAIRQYSHQ